MNAPAPSGLHGRQNIQGLLVAAFFGFLISFFLIVRKTKSKLKTCYK